ncbi:MAG: hypothetical protein ACRD5M_10320 [Candidatus Acidiferrales bacterium]
MIRNLGSRLFFIMGLAICLPAIPEAHGQSQATAAAAQTAPAEAFPAYELAKEINIHGMVQKIETVSAEGILGTHIQLRTAQGVVDVHLGRPPVASAKTLGLVIGQNVSITGMMADSGGSSVFLARVLTTSNHIFILRNEHGLPARAIMPRGSYAAANVQKGGR